MLSKSSSAKQIVVDHFLNHVVGRADDIVGDSTGFYLGIHDLVGFKFIVNDFDTGFRSSNMVKHIGIHVFAPVVNDHLAGICCRAANQQQQEEGAEPHPVRAAKVKLPHECSNKQLFS